MRDIKLTTDPDPVFDHDLAIEDFDFQFVDRRDRVHQHIRIRLLFLWQEWFLDTTYGVKYIDLIFVKNPNKVVVDNVILATITETPNVLEVLEYSSTFDPGGRSFQVTFKVNTTFGIVDDTVNTTGVI